jgi:hypothetical protein
MLINALQIVVNFDADTDRKREVKKYRMIFLRFSVVLRSWSSEQVKKE